MCSRPFETRSLLPSQFCLLCRFSQTLHSTFSVFPSISLASPRLGSLAATSQPMPVRLGPCLYWFVQLRLKEVRMVTAGFRELRVSEGQLARQMTDRPLNRVNTQLRPYGRA